MNVLWIVIGLDGTEQCCCSCSNIDTEIEKDAVLYALFEQRRDVVMKWMQWKLLENELMNRKKFIHNFDASFDLHFDETEKMSRLTLNDGPSILVRTATMVRKVSESNVKFKEILIHDILQAVKRHGIDTLSQRDFAEFRESSLKFLLNFQTNQLLHNHPIFTTSSMKQDDPSTPKKNRSQQVGTPSSPISPSVTEDYSPRFASQKNGYIDLRIDCLNVIIEIKHLHVGYMSASRNNFVGCDPYETLSERVQFQKREDKAPLATLLSIVDDLDFGTIVKEWSVARLASVYKTNGSIRFPFETFKSGYSQQTYYFEPVENILREAQRQIMNYQTDENVDRLLVISIGRRLLYQFVDKNAVENGVMDFMDV